MSVGGTERDGANRDGPVRDGMDRRTFLTGLAGAAVALTAVACGRSGPGAGAAGSAGRSGSGTAMAYWTAPAHPSNATLATDVCVYGATSAGITAAVQAAHLGNQVLLLAFDDHLGGMSAAGLGATDLGLRATVGGLAKTFYETVGKAYGTPMGVTFEPHVAAEAFERMAAAFGVAVRRFAHLKSVDKQGETITAIHLDDGTVVQAKAFVDATYEGDLLAASGVRFTTGREAAAQYGESLAGVTAVAAGAAFRKPVDPYVRPGAPASGLLAGVGAGALAAPGSGDNLVQAYGFRLCLTDRPANRIPIERPAGYNPTDYELLRRYIAQGVWDAIAFRVPVGSAKYDLNSTGALSTDLLGAGQGWATASYAERNAIFERHRAYTQGMLWFLANDPGLPDRVRNEARRLGLPKDEFTRTGGWPPLLYVREARRMVSDYVLTEADCLGRRAAPDPVALGSYKVDSHPCQRLVVDGLVTNEGTLSQAVPKRYAIPLRSIVPARGQCTNLTVPVCVSASHVAYGSVRMEPVFMMLGQAAGAVAAMAAAASGPVQDVPYNDVRTTLTQAGAVLAAV